MYTMTRTPCDGDWFPTVDYKMVDGKLMRLWIRVVPPPGVDPQRLEKGEGSVAEEWREAK